MDRHVDTIIIHCSATRPYQDIGVADIREWHVSGNGWSDIGYHWVIRRDGTLEKGRPEARSGAHTRGHNESSIGICLVGGLDENGDHSSRMAIDNPDIYTQAQWQTLKMVVTRLVDKYTIKHVRGHNQFASKSCPCFFVPDWWKSVQAQQAAEPPIENLTIVTVDEFNELVDRVNAMEATLSRVESSVAHLSQRLGI